MVLIVIDYEKGTPANMRALERYFRVQKNGSALQKKESGRGGFCILRCSDASASARSRIDFGREGREDKGHSKDFPRL
jgi:hypothetical protein